MNTSKDQGWTNHQSLEFMEQPTSMYKHAVGLCWVRQSFGKFAEPVRECQRNSKIVAIIWDIICCWGVPIQGSHPWQDQNLPLFFFPPGPTCGIRWHLLFFVILNCFREGYIPLADTKLKSLPSIEVGMTEIAYPTKVDIYCPIVYNNFHDLLMFFSILPFPKLQWLKPCSLIISLKLKVII